MGVYNKLAIMPKRCWECYHCKYEGTDTVVCEMANTIMPEYDAVEKRNDDCPLVEVKEPHGRLIDADSFVANIKKHYFDNATVMRCTEIAVENAMTIIEAEGTKE